MFRYLHTRALASAALIALMMLLTACGIDRSLGGDACLLQQYQGRSNGIVSRVQGALSTLVMHADALAPLQGTVSSSQDISDTLTAIGEFQLTLSAQWNQILNGAQPPEGAAFQASLHAAIERLDTGAQLLTQAYVDTANGDTRAAVLIIPAARDAFQRGRLLLGRANVQLAALATYSPNC